MLEAVFQHLELIEKEYFGLQFTENGLIPSVANTDLLVCLWKFLYYNFEFYLTFLFVLYIYLQKWLNPKKSLKKQMRGNLLFLILDKICVFIYSIVMFD